MNDFKGKTFSPTRQGDKPIGKCFFFNREHFEGGVGCKRNSKDCKHWHEYMSREEWEKSKTKPPSRASSPAPRGARPKSGGKDGALLIDPNECCEELLKSGRCELILKNEECSKLHVTQSQLDERNKRGKAKAGGKISSG